MLPVPLGSKTKIIGNIYCIHHFFVNNLPINNLNSHGFVYRQTELYLPEIHGYSRIWRILSQRFIAIGPGFYSNCSNQIHCIKHFYYVSLVCLHNYFNLFPVF